MVKTGLRIAMDGGTSITTLRQKIGSIYTDLTFSATLNTKNRGNYQHSCNFGVVLGSAGWQFDLLLYLEPETGLKYYCDHSYGDLPVFADFRINLSPVVDHNLWLLI